MPLPPPVIDVAPLLDPDADPRPVAAHIGAACRENGFFYVVGHGVSSGLQRRLESLSEQFFALPIERKMSIRMALGGRAWRGYFPVGAELTSGRPDVKEGLYFGEELGEDDPRVRARLPLHGANLFPSGVSGFREAVLRYMGELTRLGHRVMEGVALSLGLDRQHFAERYTGRPLTLFRIFHYPPVRVEAGGEPRWGVGEHTDYGVLTLLKQDDVGGLQVRSGGAWIDAPPVADSFVCNIGDMLDRMTGGLYRSTPHRVLNTSGRERYSYPFFFDPGFDVRVQPLDLPGATQSQSPETADTTDRGQRWDGADVHAFEGTYGDYVMGKVARVFPELFEAL